MRVQVKITNKFLIEYFGVKANDVLTVLQKDVSDNKLAPKTLYLVQSKKTLPITLYGSEVMEVHDEN